MRRSFLRPLAATAVVVLACTHQPSHTLGAAAMDPERPQAGQRQGGAAQTTPPENLPRVFLYATGGTISNRQGAQGRLTMQELLDSVPGLPNIARADGEQFANIASGAMTLKQWIDLSRRINERFRREADLAGVVVTSGTDTLEELAFFLHLTVRDERPVVIVGSMRNPSQTGYEGIANLEDAFRVAADPASRGMGALVVLNDEINSARDATKTDARALDTFTSREYGILGTVYDRVAYVRKPLRRHTAASEFDVMKIDELPRVDVVWTYQGAPGDIIKAIVDLGAKGIIFAGAGAGASSGTQNEGLRYATDKGVFTVNTTRTGQGNGVGGGRGGSTRLTGGDLQPVKARVLLMLALATTQDPAEVARILREY
jgi:L-asparaginase